MATRYHYFAELKETLEELVHQHPDHRSVAIVAHSLGNRVIQYFLEQIVHEDPVRGQAWIDRHIGRFIAVSALWLGVPKSVREALTDVKALGLSAIEGVKPRYQSYGALPWMLPVTEAQYRFLNTEFFAFLEDDAHPLAIVEALDRGGAISTLRHRRDFYQENPLFTPPGRAFGSLAVERPRTPALNVFHATEQPTEVGAYYRPGPGSTLVLDTAATSTDPSFRVEQGVRLEIAGQTRQTIDGTLTSGDGFLSFGSLTYFKVWQEECPHAEITGRAFPGRTHYGILEDERFLHEVVCLVAGEESRGQAV